MDQTEFSIRARFRHAMNAAGVGDGASLLVGVSGGCDSMSLLRLCLDDGPRRGWRVTAAHIDHALRSGSADDAAWLEDEARAAGVPLRVLRVRPAHWEALRGRSIEAEARRLRRSGLRRLARQAGARWILLGHTRDDQAETVLLHLLRGTGVRGLGGISPCRPPWLRPLLAVPRSELRALAAARGLRWREDPSNEDPRFLRNRIRLRLLPLLEQEFQPGAAAVLARVAEGIRPVRRFLEAEAARAWERLAPEEDEAGIRLERVPLATYHPIIVEEVLRRAFCRLRGSGQDLGRGHLAPLARAAAAGRPRAFHLPAGIVATVNRREVRLSHQKRNAEGNAWT